MTNGMGFLGFLGVLGTSFVSLWAIFKYILLGSYRLTGDTSKRLIDKIRKDAAWSWVLTGEYAEPPRYPNVYETVAYMSGVLFFFSRSERLMTAGWKGKEDVSTITFLRWQKRRVEALIKDGCNDNTIPIAALSCGSQDKLGHLDPDPNARVYLNSGSYEDMVDEVERVVTGDKKKTGLLLYGPPGNGKTQFVKYLSRKFALPIYVVYLRTDYDNYDVARMFSEIPRRCIVLLEDFDNYFSGRKCIMKNGEVQFTFDSFINALDGVHNDYDGVVFAMTTNDITKVDDALKNRPSRFKFVRKFDNPDDDVRRTILGDEHLVEATRGATLDAVFAAAAARNAGRSQQCELFDFDPQRTNE